MAETRSKTAQGEVILELNRGTREVEGSTGPGSALTSIVPR
jgi:hypothetical protein